MNERTVSITDEKAGNRCESVISYISMHIFYRIMIISTCKRWGMAETNWLLGKNKFSFYQALK